MGVASMANSKAAMADLANHYRYIPPTPDMVRKCNTVRQMLFEVAVGLNDALPEGRERALAQTKIEECLHWAVAALERA